MSDTQHITISLGSELHEWLVGDAKARSMTVEEIVVSLIKEERQRSAMEAMAAWAREDEDGPSTQQIDLLRAGLLAEEDEAT